MRRKEQKLELYKVMYLDKWDNYRDVLSEISDNLIKKSGRVLEKRRELTPEALHNGDYDVGNITRSIVNEIMYIHQNLQVPYLMKLAEEITILRIRIEQLEKEKDPVDELTGLG